MVFTTFAKKFRIIEDNSRNRIMKKIFVPGQFILWVFQDNGILNSYLYRYDHITVQFFSGGLQKRKFIFLSVFLMPISINQSIEKPKKNTFL